MEPRQHPGLVQEAVKLLPVDRSQRMRQLCFSSLDDCCDAAVLGETWCYTLQQPADPPQMSDIPAQRAHASDAQQIAERPPAIPSSSEHRLLTHLFPPMVCTACQSAHILTAMMLSDLEMWTLEVERFLG
eukprot:760806-Hanusia_phi.AAC.3